MTTADIFTSVCQAAFLCLGIVAAALALLDYVTGGEHTGR
jgi:hypothetical protein